MRPLAQTNGHDPPRLIDEFIPCLAAVIDEIVVGFEDAVMTAKLNDVDPQAWLTDVLARIADMPQSRIAELLPWNWDHPNLQMVA